MRMLIIAALVVLVGVMTSDSCPTLCPMDYTPVCGSDGQTYSNRCQLGVVACATKKDLVVVHEGQCQAAADFSSCMKPCNRRYSPVCATDGQTYSNQCLMEVEACQRGETLEVAHQGEC